MLRWRSSLKAMEQHILLKCNHRMIWPLSRYARQRFWSVIRKAGLTSILILWTTSSKKYDTVENLKHQEASAILEMSSIYGKKCSGKINWEKISGETIKSEKLATFQLDVYFQMFSWSDWQLNQASFWSILAVTKQAYTIHSWVDTIPWVWLS